MALLFVLLQLVFGILMGSGSRIQARTIVACPRRNMYFHITADGNASCQPCSLCPKGTQKKRCSQWHGSECEFCPTGSYNRRSGARCKQCTTCQPGEYVLRPCSPSADAVCLRCPNGSFSTTKNAHRCTPCTRCRQHEERLHVCNTTSDYGCGKCKQGYFRESATGGCLPCSKCFPETYVVPECSERGGGKSGKLCMPTDRMRWIYVAAESTTVEYIMTEADTGDHIPVLRGVSVIILVLTVSLLAVYFMIRNSKPLKQYLRLERDTEKIQPDISQNGTDRSMGDKVLELIKKYSRSLITILIKRKHTKPISRCDSESSVYEIAEGCEQGVKSAMTISENKIETLFESCSDMTYTIPRTHLEQCNSRTDISSGTCNSTDDAREPLSSANDSGSNDSPSQTSLDEVPTTQSMERRPKATKSTAKKRRRDTASAFFANPKYFSLYNTF